MSETPDAQRPNRSGVHRHSTGPALDCAAVHELAASYALAALETDEREQVEHHNRRCPDCVKMLEDIRFALSAFAFSVPMASPRPVVKSELISRITLAGQPDRSFRQPVTSPTVAPSLDRTLTIPSSREALAPIPAGWSGSSPARPAVPPSNVVRGGRFRPNWQFLATPLATVPLVLALGIVGLWAMNTQNKLSARSSEVNSLSQQVSVLNRQVTALNVSLDSVDNFVAQTNAKSYDMAPRSTADASDAFGRVIANPGTDQAMLVVQNLDGDQSLYEVLVESPSGTMISAGEVPVNDEGDGITVLKLSQPFAMYKSVHVKPKLMETSFGSSDSFTRTEPDALFATIDPNLGASDDTDAPNVGQSS